eukprot:Trichotokara_eunicae@DN5027_c0_g1_i2.p1
MPANYAGVVFRSATDVDTLPPTERYSHSHSEASSTSVHPSSMAPRHVGTTVSIFRAVDSPVFQIGREAHQISFSIGTEYDHAHLFGLSQIGLNSVPISIAPSGPQHLVHKN